MRRPHSRQFRHGKRVEMDCICFIEEAFDASSKLKTPMHITDIVEMCSRQFRVSRTNVFRWWGYYQEHFETKAVVREKMISLKRRYKWSSRSVNPKYILEVKRVIEEHPEFFLDEIAKEVSLATGAYFSLSKISRIICINLSSSLQVCYHRARQHRSLCLTVHLGDVAYLQ